MGKDDSFASAQTFESQSLGDVIASLFKSIKRKLNDSSATATTLSKKPEVEDVHTPVIIEEVPFMILNRALKLQTLTFLRDKAQQLTEVEQSQDPLLRITFPDSPEALNRLCEDLDLCLTWKDPLPSKSQSPTFISKFDDLFQLVIQSPSFATLKPPQLSSYTQDRRFAVLKQFLSVYTFPA